MSNYIADFLRSNGNVGAKNGIKSPELLVALGRSTEKDSRRRLQKEIQQIRRKWDYMTDSIDEFIVSDSLNGYYIPANDNEMWRFFVTSNKRAIQGFATIKPARAYLKSKGFFDKTG